MKPPFLWLGHEVPHKVDIVFDDITVEAEVRVDQRMPPTLLNAVINGVRQFHGKVTYNGESCTSTPHYLCAYVSQYDLHHAEMTVRETIGFASNMLGANNEFGEMLVGRARCFFMDDGSTGLDSSTTFEIMTILRQMAHLMDHTMVTSKMDQKQYWAGDEMEYQYHSIEKFVKFFKTKMKHETVFDGNKYMGALFMAVAAVNFNGMAELTMTIKRLPIFYKQRELLGLPGWSMLCSIFLLSIPMSLLESVLWTFSTYYAIGYAPSPVRFFQQLLVLFMMHQMSMSLYRFLASIGRTQVMANMLGTEALIAMFILGGFIISKDDLQPWLSWGSWASPFTYSLNAVALNEFLDNRWATVFYYENAKTTGEAILKVRGLRNEWHWYWGVRERRLQLLENVSGAFRPGVLTALMGITVAGKTTLLDVLAGRKTGGYIEGTINVAGYHKKQETFSRISGYCEQTDIHSPYLTVYESLQFSAYLRLPSDCHPHQRDMFIEEVMELVELTNLRDAIVGTRGVTGLSAEQRKRLTVAVELVASPSIIFMDEPTSGLDARAAAIVMRTVRKTVNTGRTVVCTIHQPSIEIFESFDEVCTLSMYRFHQPEKKIYKKSHYFLRSFIVQNTYYSSLRVIS
ncbi:hypothetical protein PR202_gb16901 [Eleusine coracana subsp. coracana]|uniref:ABC transporter domain-containing protein n=1 Tax=Eleusine coracana subsp. coracana TaxID=191504 RepID=A0AAV5F0Z9_ELECO|nr:hypothetical protein PR202_gb16901 [Eleusine coracana subsp. coracana]